MAATKIEWCDQTINPVSGCLRGCPFFYARRRAVRLAGMERKHPGSSGYPTEGDPFRPTFHPNRIDQILALKGTRKRIFLDSMGDLFSDGVKQEWFDAVIDAVRQKPEHTFMVLTKWPRNLWMMPLKVIPNLWIGTSVTCQRDEHRISDLRDMLPQATPKFVSFEPLHGPIKVDLKGIKWVVIGAETGNRKGKVKPQVEWIRNLQRQAERLDIPIFFKDNLGLDGPRQRVS